MSKARFGICAGSIAMFSVAACDAGAPAGHVEVAGQRANLEGMILPGCGGGGGEDVFVGEVSVDSTEADTIEVIAQLEGESGEVLETLVFEVGADGLFEIDTVPPEATALSVYLIVDGEEVDADTLPLDD